MAERMLAVIRLGLIDFYRAWQFQEKVREALVRRQRSNTLIVCRHYPVITLGRGALRTNILVSEGELLKRGIAVYSIDRGGDVTYHGPGQLTVYPILDLHGYQKDIHWYLRQLEDAGIDFLSGWGLMAARRRHATGIWIDNRKIASIGIAIRHWITYHGMTVNINSNDLANFALIRPCGMDIGMTSLETEAGSSVSIEDAEEVLIEKFRYYFHRFDVSVNLVETAGGMR
jgi:lipoate-protein ligase B